MSESRISINNYDLEMALQDSVSAFMNALAPDAPPLHWSLRLRPGGTELSGLVPPEAHDDPGAVVDRWATLIGLEVVENWAGARGLSGRVPRLNVAEVVVWAVVDRDEFEGRKAPATTDEDGAL